MHRAIARCERARSIVPALAVRFSIPASERTRACTAHRGCDSASAHRPARSLSSAPALSRPLFPSRLQASLPRAAPNQRASRPSVANVARDIAAHSATMTARPPNGSWGAILDRRSDAQTDTQHTQSRQQRPRLPQSALTALLSSPVFVCLFVCLALIPQRRDLPESPHRRSARRRSRREPMGR